MTAPPRSTARMPSPAWSTSFSRVARHGSAAISGGQYDGSQGETWQGGADTGFALGNDGWLHVSARAMHQDPTNHAGPDPRYPDDPTFNTVTFHYGLPQTRTKQAAINFQYAFAEQAELYAFSVFNKRNVSAGGFFRSLSTYQTSHPAAASVYPQGYLPMENSAIRDDSEVIGLRGSIDGWHYDVSANSGGNHWKLHTSNTFNYSLGADSPTRLLYRHAAQSTERVQSRFQQGVRRRPADAADSGLGRRNTGTRNSASSKAMSFLRRRRRAGISRATSRWMPARTRATTPRRTSTWKPTSPTSSPRPGRPPRELQRFRQRHRWKLSGRYAFNDTVAMRGTASTGFRAPSLQQEYYSSTSINFVDVGGGTLVPFTVRTFPVDDPAAVALGAQPLKAEKSRNFSLGLVFTPLNGLYTTLDLYQVDIDKRIILSGNLVGDAVQRLPGLGRHPVRQRWPLLHQCHRHPDPGR